MNNLWNASRWLVVALVAVGLTVACESGGDKAAEGEKSEDKAAADKAPAEEKAPEKPAEVPAKEAEKAEAPAADQKSIPQKRREKLAKAFKAVYCAQRNDVGDDILGVYKTHGFDSAADWNSAWASDARKKPEWAQQVLAEAKADTCGAAPIKKAEKGKKKKKKK